ncbi:MAG: hypothetical protein E7021_04970 [Alphaproteobacteria bacterium]|nr:hypothetical protein [Alphaproteobacteria bacterium]
MSKEKDEIKKELKTLYPNENLTDEELTQIAQNLVEFFEIGVRSLDKKTTPEMGVVCFGTACLANTEPNIYRILKTWHSRWNF